MAKPARFSSGAFSATAGLAAVLAAAGPVGSPTMPDVNGKPIRPLETKGRKATLLVFVTHDCPIANAYAPEIGRIAKAYGPRGVASFLIYTDPALSATEAKKHAVAYGYPCPALRDPKHRLVQAVRAKMSPEAVILGADGSALYRGRIDDRYVDFGKGRVQPTKRDLRNALDAALAHKPVPAPGGKVIGCDIPLR